MKRITFDRLVTMVGFGVAVFLLIAAGLLNWGANFAHGTVEVQLKAQQITMPAETGDPKASAETVAFFKENGKSIMSNGKQAQMYADHYIAFHVAGMPPYAAASGLSRAAAAALAADPTNTVLQTEADKARVIVETVFKGETLRGMLLNAYAFGTLGDIAAIASMVALAGAIFMFIFVYMGILHIRRTPVSATI